MTALRYLVTLLRLFTQRPDRYDWRTERPANLWISRKAVERLRYDDMCRGELDRRWEVRQ